MLPSSSKQPTTNTDDEFDTSYASMGLCYFVDSVTNGWIIDSRALNHMASCSSMLVGVVASKNEPRINLPSGQTTNITHFGSVKLKNDLLLKNVLFVPSFKHNLISVDSC